jgi:serine/threonine-protein kinase
MTAAVGQGHLLAGRYRLEEFVAAGGAGTVWRGMDLVLERLVAVKLLRPEVASDPQAAANFLAEARSASRLSHPGIAQVHDYGGAGPTDVPFLVMELVDGPALSEVLVSGPLGPERTVNVLAQVAAGLDAAHSAGVVHRDIKPANLLTNRLGQVKITDFGIARVIGAAPVTATGAVTGTPAYLAPERAAGASATPASDLYSLGVVAYECLTGTRPFSGPAAVVSAAHLQRHFPALPASVPANIAALVRDLTAKDPARRPQSAREVAARVAALRPGPAGETALREEMCSNWTAAGQVPAELVTLTDAAVTVPPGGSVSQPGPAASVSRRRWRAAGAMLAVAAALMMVGLIGWQVGLTRQSASSGAVARGTAVSPAVPGVAVNPAAFIGLPVGDVLVSLRRMGLRPVLVRVATAGQPPGTVVAVRPGGTLRPGSTVMVVAAVTPRQVSGHDGGGGGNGGGGGDNGGGPGGGSDGGSGGGGPGGGGDGGH